MAIDFLELIRREDQKVEKPPGMWMISFIEKLAFNFLSSFNDIEILVALADGEGSGPWEEFMAEDFCDEDVLGHVFGFKAVAADSGVGASQVAWFPGLVQGAEDLWQACCASSVRSYDPASISTPMRAVRCLETGLLWRYRWSCPL
jgi:hypothetical protein